MLGNNVTTNVSAETSAAIMMDFCSIDDACENA
jgi:hypothetical protein